MELIVKNVPQVVDNAEVILAAVIVNTDMLWYLDNASHVGRIVFNVSPWTQVYARSVSMVFPWSMVSVSTSVKQAALNATMLIPQSATNVMRVML